MDKTEDQLAVLQHHDAIAGTEAQYVELDYSTNLARAFAGSEGTYKKHVVDTLREEAGITIKDGP